MCYFTETTANEIASAMVILRPTVDVSAGDQGETPQ